MIRITLFASMAALLCACTDKPAPAATATESVVVAEAVAAPIAPVQSLLGTELLPPDPIPNQAKLEANLAEARAVLAANPDDPEALIWVGRRLAYLWRYQDAIEVFTQGIERWPDNPKFYRHRGHRYLTVRDFPRALADFQTAATMIEGKPDEIEPDGAPNPANIPRTTLAYNIWYHLGLLHYLQGDYQKALDAYDRLAKISNDDDSIVAMTDWQWMSLMRLGRKDEAAALLEKIKPQMDLLENHSYHRRLLMYKGLEKPESLLTVASGDTTDIATQGYGVGNFYLVNGDPARARQVFEKVVATPGWNAFGYIAAENDLQRMQ